MIASVQKCDLTNYNWPVVQQPARSKTESNYIFSYRDEPYFHPYGGRWTLFTEYTASTEVDTWA